jgi:hypothetical protein
VSFVLKSSNSIAAGTFNIYVFQPSHVGRIAGLPDDAKFEMESDFSKPGFLLSLGTSKWTVRPDRVIIESDSPNENCGLVLSKVLDWLPVTPIAAIGHNFKYVGGLPDFPNAERMTASLPMATLEGYSTKQRTWHVAHEREGIVFNLQVGIRDSEVHATANVHFESPPDAHENRIRFAKEFFEFRDTAVHLFERSFGLELPR